MGIRGGQEAGNLTKFGAGIGDGGGHVLKCPARGGLIGVEGQKRRPGRGIRLRLGLRNRLRDCAGSLRLLQGLTGASEGIALDVDQILDSQGQLDVTATVEPLAGPTLVGLELGELGLPKA